MCKPATDGKGQSSRKAQYADQTLWRYKMTQQNIISDPKVMMGQPVVAGTRITVDLILEKLSSGETFDQLLQAHPRLTREGIQAALNFAREALRADVIYPIAESN
jgi:uncharacterized protein (DUF433 family)